jgi:histidinol phosphatase-like PHP family hydrolase
MKNIERDYFENEEAEREGAKRRIKMAEKKGELSLSHYRGELHAHSREGTNMGLPEKIVETRHGSNCGCIPLRVLVEYHVQEMKNDFLAVTEHSRDPDSPVRVLENVSNWFEGLYLNNENWLRDNFGKTKGELSDEDQKKIRDIVEEEARKLIFYGDERIEDALARMEALGKEKDNLRLFKGIEANLLPNGNFDTELVEQGRFELVNCSIHPQEGVKEYEEIVSDPNKYTDLVVRGIENPKTNIICHIGHGVKRGVAEQLDWQRISKAALENKVAIEINLKGLMNFINKEILDYKKFSKNDNSYQDYLKNKLPELVPIISSPSIRGQLTPYFEKGLKIAINTDVHRSKFVENEETETGEIISRFKERDFRFWRALKIVEKYFNEILRELNIGKENIINTFSIADLELFLRKKV